ncbi:MAG: hydroxymethylbilane synthase [Pseudomonadota bacterium]
MKPLRIATRRSALALWQAEHVAARLRALQPDRPVELVPMTTRGDRLLDRPLAEIGGKGLFLKELEVAIQHGEADIAVHSMKDVPMQLEAGFAIGAVLERADPLDAFVSNHYAGIEALTPGVRVGTSSLRRRSLLRALRPDLQVEDLRGNVNTRLAKLDAGEFDAIILACAGLDRLGMGDRIRARLPAPRWLPAVAQGAIGIEVRADDVAARDAVAPLVHAETTLCVAAERAMNRVLQGSCDVPIAGHATLEAGRLSLHGLVGDPLAGRLIRAEGADLASAAEALGERVALDLLARGADAILHGRQPR